MSTIFSCRIVDASANVWPKMNCRVSSFLQDGTRRRAVFVAVVRSPSVQAVTLQRKEGSGLARWGQAPTNQSSTLSPTPIEAPRHA